MEPGWIDQLAVGLGRPWVFALAFAFTLTPTHWLLAALNTGAGFLKIGTGARPAALGGAYTAAADDIDALYYNPGALGRLGRRELGATHARWLFDSSFDFIGYAEPTRAGTIGLGVTRLSMGQLSGRGADRRETGGFAATDTAYALSFGRALARDGRWGGGSTSLGANLKLLHSRIGEHSARTTAFDFGLHRDFAELPLSLGASVLNAGKGLSYRRRADPLPLTIAAGASYRFAGALNLALDVRRGVHEERTQVGIGSEYALGPGLALRLGYASPLAAAGSGGAFGAFGGLGGGVGIKLRGYRADYTFSPFGELGNVQRVSLGASW